MQGRSKMLHFAIVCFCLFTVKDFLIYRSYFLTFEESKEDSPISECIACMDSAPIVSMMNCCMFFLPTYLLNIASLYTFLQN